MITSMAEGALNRPLFLRKYSIMESKKSPTAIPMLPTFSDVMLVVMLVFQSCTRINKIELKIGLVAHT